MGETKPFDTIQRIKAEKLQKAQEKLKEKEKAK